MMTFRGICGIISARKCGERAQKACTWSDENVSVPQRTNSFDGFQATHGNESEGRGSLGKAGDTHPVELD